MVELKVDFERESLKDCIYLLEQQMLLEEEIQKELDSRQPAKIFVIKEKIEENEYNPLPF